MIDKEIYAVVEKEAKKRSFYLDEEVYNYIEKRTKNYLSKKIDDMKIRCEGEEHKDKILNHVDQFINEIDDAIFKKVVIENIPIEEIISIRVKVIAEKNRKIDIEVDINTVKQA